MPETLAPQQSPSSVLYRSHIEIGRILQGMAGECIALFAYIVDRDDEQLFVSQIQSVHPDAGSFVVSYGPSKSLNGALFRQPALRFKANYRGGRISFVAQRPLDGTFGGQPVLRFAFPSALLHYYREHRRVSLPGEAALRCVAGAPGEPQLELRVVDISQDGMGCVLHREGGGLGKGAVLRDCRIFLPNGTTVAADLMVRHSAAATLKDGSVGWRTGVRFVQTPAEIRPLIDQFVRVLDDTGA